MEAVRAAPPWVSHRRADSPQGDIDRVTDAAGTGIRAAPRIGPELARAAALVRARRHSRLVRRLRWMLPALSLVLFVSFWGSALLGTLLRGTGIGFGGIDLAALVDGELVMAEPDISGTINGRRFEVTADRAIQDVTRQDQVRFESPTAVLDGPQGRIDLTAGNALYGVESETLALDGGVDVRTVRGQTARLQDAKVDLAAGSLVSTSPVTLDGPQGRIEALGIQIDDSGARVLFTGRVRARFTPSGGPDDEVGDEVGDASPPAAPAPTVPASTLRAAPDPTISSPTGD